MIFYSLLDLLVDRSTSNGKSAKEMYTFFSSKGIKKAALLELRQTSYIPEDEYFSRAIEEYLGMTALEINLAMGHIPPEYQDSYCASIPQIAKLLRKEEKLCDRQVFTPYYQTELGSLYQGDCIEIMKSIGSGTVDLIFADPPFNLGKAYDPGVSDSMTMSSYVNWMQRWLCECVRLLKPGGQIYVYNLPKWCVYIAHFLGETLTFTNWIAVDMKFSLPIPNRLYPAHYALVSFTKGTKPRVFNNQRIPMMTCRHCGGDIKDYGGYKGKMNPNGINVSDVWTDIYPVRHKNDKNRKFNELSVKLLDRILSMATNEGDVVFDPFGGSGTTYAVAELLGRRWLGCELGDCDVIKNRLQNPERDLDQLKKIRISTNCLFTPEATALRKKNGFWLCDDVINSNTNKAMDHDQISLLDS